MSLDSRILATVNDEVPDISPVGASYLVDNSRRSEIAIFVKPNATAAQHEAAYAVGLACIDRLGGCPDRSQSFHRLP
jgi:hypothetical protein